MDIKLIDIKFTGKGTDKQIAYAASIYDKMIADINNLIDTANIRVRDGSMPTIWTDCVNSVIDVAMPGIVKSAQYDAALVISKKDVFATQAHKLSQKMEDVYNLKRAQSN